MTKKIVIFIAVLLVLIGSLSYLAYQETEGVRGVSIDIEKVKKQYPGELERIQEVEAAQAALESDSSKPELYVRLGLAWKSLGEMTKDPRFFKKAREVYAQAVELTGWKNSLLTINAGAVSELLEDWVEAERYYKAAVQNTPADPDGYQRLAALYRFKLQKSPEEVLGVYDRGLSILVFGAPLLLEKAEYLNSLGRFKEALEAYRRVYETNPSPERAALIAELEQKIKK